MHSISVIASVTKLSAVLSLVQREIEKGLTRAKEGEVGGVGVYVGEISLSL